MLLKNFAGNWEKRDGMVVHGGGTVSTFVKRLDNGTLPRGRENREKAMEELIGNTVDRR